MINGYFVKPDLGDCEIKSSIGIYIFRVFVQEALFEFIVSVFVFLMCINSPSGQ